jgi:1,4-dihydroxy-2-naphthoate octaprenyltransferase
LASHGLGDIFVFIFFGLVAVAGTYFVQALTLSSWTLLVAMPIGTLITAIIVVNNLRDIETDQAAGKITLAVMMGEKATRLEYHTLLIVAYVMPLFMWLQGWQIWVMLPWLTLPLAGVLMRRIEHIDAGAEFNKLLGQTAQLALIFSVLFSIGMVLQRVFQS